MGDTGHQDDLAGAMQLMQQQMFQMQQAIQAQDAAAQQAAIAQQEQQAQAPPRQGFAPRRPSSSTSLQPTNPCGYYHPDEDICSLQHVYNSPYWLRPRSPAHQQGPSMLTEAPRHIMLTAAYRQIRRHPKTDPDSWNHRSKIKKTLRSSLSPPGGKKQLLLTGPMVRTAGNTSPWEGLNHKSDLYSRWFQPVPGPNLKADLYNLWRSQKRSSWKYCRHTRQPLRGGYNALEYLSNSTRVVPRKEPCPSAGNTAAPPPAKEPEKMQTLHQGVLVFTASIHLGQRGVKEAGEHTFPLLFIHKKKPTLWVPGPSFQVPDPRFQIFGCSPCKEEAKNTCLSRFLREDATRRKVGANKLSVNPRGNTHQQIPSTCPWQRRFKMRRQVIE
ncbi:hypothetical protein DY000_02006591 [Brassica cretica]|uniref:Uncharacterized protein n=1 Tax=Brassica cretica TaxID=69181 RepID=A0ABQ7C4E3_BRACR|nr:hypothetical protein DY000_02006591 [Brassica cretica]